MKPVLQALVLADHVYTDSVTGKKIVAGIFHRLWFRKNVPPEVRDVGGQATATFQIQPSGHQAGSPFCYVSLTDVHGEQDFEMRFVDLGDNKSLFGTTFRVKSDDPLQTVEVVVPLPMLPTNKPGTFALELLWNGEPLGAHRVVVGEIPQKGTAG